MAELLQISGMTEEMRARLDAVFDITDLREQSDTEAFLEAEGGRFTHVLTDGHLGVKPPVMDRLPNLKMISCYGVGYDNIDAAEAHRRGIMVTHTPNVLNAEVANTALLLILACYRELLRDDAWVRSGDWEAKGNTGQPDHRHSRHGADRAGDRRAAGAVQSYGALSHAQPKRRAV